jgi:hypothetical protein
MVPPPWIAPDCRSCGHQRLIRPSPLCSAAHLLALSRWSGRMGHCIAMDLTRTRSQVQTLSRPHPANAFPKSPCGERCQPGCYYGVTGPGPAELSAARRSPPGCPIEVGLSGAADPQIGLQAVAAHRLLAAATVCNWAGGPALADGQGRWAGCWWGWLVPDWRGGADQGRLMSMGGG